jgi:hypothetical protein
MFRAKRKARNESVRPLRGLRLPSASLAFDAGYSDHGSLDDVDHLAPQDRRHLCGDVQANARSMKMASTCPLLTSVSPLTLDL